MKIGILGTRSKQNSASDLHGKATALATSHGGSSPSLVPAGSQVTLAMRTACKRKTVWKRKRRCTNCLSHECKQHAWENRTPSTSQKLVPAGSILAPIRFLLKNITFSTSRCSAPTGSHSGSHPEIADTLKRNVDFLNFETCGSHWLPLRLPFVLQEAFSETLNLDARPYSYYNTK